MIYLDYMATTPMDPAVIEAMTACFGIEGTFGNPASEHAFGYAAREKVDTATEQVAKALGVDAKEVVWTSGATEANNLAIKGAAQFYQRQGKHIVTCATEHKAVLDVCKALEDDGFEVTVIQPQKNGLINFTEFQKAFRTDTILASVMWVNNETGVVQDVAALAEIAHESGALFHTDATQAMGKLPIDLKQAGVDLASFSAHKCYGPKGVGVLYVSRKPRVHLHAQIHGGGHQFRLRSGTLAVPQIVGTGMAFELAAENVAEDAKRLEKFRDQIWQALNQLGDVERVVEGAPTVANCLNVIVKGVEAETCFKVLTANLAISKGSACNAATILPSHVLTAMGYSPEQADHAIRISVGRYTSDADIQQAITVLVDAISSMRP